MSISSAQSVTPDPIQADLYIEVDARIGADDLAGLAIEQFTPFFESVTDDPALRDAADLTGRLELWRYGNVPGAGWTCIADIALDIYSNDGELIYRDIGRGCGATKLRKGLFEAALEELGQRSHAAPQLREFVRTGRTTEPPRSPRAPRLEHTIELTADLLEARVTWDLVLDPTEPRSALFMISDPRRRSRGITQIAMRNDSLEVTENPPGLPPGNPVELMSSAEGEIFARIDDQQFRLEHGGWSELEGFPPCYESIAVEARGYCSVVVRGSDVDSPRRWRIEVIGGSGIGAAALLPIPMLYRAPKLVVAPAPFSEAPFFIVLDRETTIDFSPDFGALGAQPGWSYLPWDMQLDSAGIAHVLARTSRPDDLRYARIDFPALRDELADLEEARVPEEDQSLRDLIEARIIVDVDSQQLKPSCNGCSFALAVDPDSGTAMALSRELRDTWDATFITDGGNPVTTALPDMVWPLDVLAASDDRFYILGYLPLALAGSPGRLGIYSIAPDQPIEHVVTLTLNAWALLPPVGFELDRSTGSILTVWREGREGLRAAWFDPQSFDTR